MADLVPRLWRMHTYRLGPFRVWFRRQHDGPYPGHPEQHRLLWFGASAWWYELEITITRTASPE